MEEIDGRAGKRRQLASDITDDTERVKKIRSWVNVITENYKVSEEEKQAIEKLHKDKPDLYKDANHKPEMAIALTPFEAMCETRVLQFVVSRGVRVYRSEIVSKSRDSLIDVHTGADRSRATC